MKTTDDKHLSWEDRKMHVTRQKMIDGERHMEDHGTYINTDEKDMTEEKNFLILCSNVYTLSWKINWTPKWYREPNFI